MTALTRDQIVARLRAHDMMGLYNVCDAAADLIEADGAIREHSIELTSDLYAADTKIEELQADLARDRDIFRTMDAKIARLEALLADALAGLNTALGMVEEDNFIPSWDYLREVRARIQSALNPPTPGGNHD
jgi:hypothetical protein